MRCWVGCATWTLKPLQLALWQDDPRALKCFAFASLDQMELFNVTSNALFSVLQVWQDLFAL